MRDREQAVAVRRTRSMNATWSPRCAATDELSIHRRLSLGARRGRRSNHLSVYIVSVANAWKCTVAAASVCAFSPRASAKFAVGNLGVALPGAVRFFEHSRKSAGTSRRGSRRMEAFVALSRSGTWPSGRGCVPWLAAERIRVALVRRLSITTVRSPTSTTVTSMRWFEGSPYSTGVAFDRLGQEAHVVAAIVLAGGRPACRSTAMLDLLPGDRAEVDGDRLVRVEARDGWSGIRSNRPRCRPRLGSGFVPALVGFGRTIAASDHIRTYRSVRVRAGRSCRWSGISTTFIHSLQGSGSSSRTGNLVRIGWSDGRPPQGAGATGKVVLAFDGWRRDRRTWRQRW